MIALICDKCDTLLEGSEEALDTYESGVLSTPVMDDEGLSGVGRFRVNVFFEKVGSSGGLERRLHLCRDCKIKLLESVGDMAWK